VAERPYVLLSVAMSVDGCIDDASGTRLILSNEGDLDRVDEVRAGCDAILVGAGTVRRDNPALQVRSPARRAARTAAGRPATPARVTITARGDLDPAARFFAAGEGARLVYVPAGQRGRIAARLGAGPASGPAAGPAGPAGPAAGPAAVEVIAAGDPLSLDTVLADLAARGVARLLVEGGGTVLAQFLAQGLADELHLVIAPVFVGDPDAPRIAGAAGATGAAGPGGRLHLAEARPIGDVVLLRYLPSPPSWPPSDRRLIAV
jgi:5-amino-6-(5-phosphoribosylamino)uracil reductase